MPRVRRRALHARAGRAGRRCWCTAWTADQGALLFLHNLGRTDAVVDVGPQPGQEGPPVEVFADRAYPPVGPDLAGIPVAASGYRWLRLGSGR